MKKLTRAAFLLLFISSAAMAQTVEDDFNTSGGRKPFKESKISNLAGRLTDYLEKIELKGVDTNYVGAPKRKWSFFGNTYLADVHLNLQSRGLRDEEDVFDIGKIKIHLHSQLQDQASFGAYFMGYGISYSWDINKHYNKDLSLSMYASRFGGEVRFHSTKSVEGRLTIKSQDELFDKLKEPINKGTTKIESFILNAYYVFNPTKFSYNAAMSYSKIQKKSAGSFFAGLTLFQNRMSMYDVENPDVSVVTLLMSGVDKIQIKQGAVGVGYAYNWVPAKGFNFHISGLPMLLVTTRSVTKATGMWSDEQQAVQRKLFGGNTHVSYTYMLRGSASYRPNDRFIVGISGFFNHFQVGHKGSYYTSTDDWIARAFVGVYF